MKRRRGRLAGVAVVAAVLGLGGGLAGPALAAGPLPVGTTRAQPVAGGVALTTGSNPVLDFAGTFSSPTPLPTVNPPALLPQVCQVDCQEWSLQVATAQPVLVSVENANASVDDGIDLYVYDPSDQLVASANGIGSNGEAVEIPKPVSGSYTVVVAITYAYNQTVHYLGEARVMAPPSWQQTATCGITVGGHKGCFYIPSLVALPASDLHVSGLPPAPSTPLGYPLPVSTPVPTSCYLNESLSLDSPSVSGLEHPVTRCLRFTTEVENVGSGPMEVHVRAAAVNPGQVPQLGYVPGDCQAVQVVYATDGSTYTRPAGSCQSYPDAPPDLPYGNVVAFSLYPVEASGAFGPEIGSGYKASYCLSDDDYFGFGTAGPNGPNTYTGQPSCDDPSYVDRSQGGASAWITEGISPGWGDVYTWDTADQFLNITGVPNGRYAIVERVNPNGDMLATSPHPCSYTDVALTQSSATAVGSGYLSTCPPGSAGPGGSTW